MEKILIFGGSFNPIHKGHIHLVTKAAEKLKTEKTVIVPTGKSGYKVTDNFASCEDRLEMCRLALADTDIEISTVETDCENQSYTYSTLEKLGEIYKNSRFYFLMGSDMFLSLHKLKNPGLVTKRAIIAVALRNSDELSDLVDYKNKNFKDAEIIFLEIEKMDVSSTEIREDIKMGKIPKGLEKSVYDYIKNKNLYTQ